MRELRPSFPRGAGRQRVAMTGRYLTVTFPAPDDADLTGRVVRVRIEAVTPAGLAGRLVP